MPVNKSQVRNILKRYPSKNIISKTQLIEVRRSCQPTVVACKNKDH